MALLGRSLGALGALLDRSWVFLEGVWVTPGLPNTILVCFASSEGRFGILSDRIALQPSTLYWGAISGGLSSASPQRRCNNDDSRMSRANANNDTTTT